MDTSAGALSSAVRHIAPVFQPVLWLDDLSVAGYEALSRGPESSAFALPLDLLAAARVYGVVDELESAMTCAAIDAVLEQPWDRSVALFANLEPGAMAAPPLPAAVQALERAEADGIRVVAEITERSLLAHPAALIASSTAIRSRGWGVAMDDAGAGGGDETLTLLWVLQPDVVKLDMSILHGAFDARSARVSATVRDYCDRTGALMVCEGVETAAHEARARALGVDLVQGFRYAMPATRPASIPPTTRPVDLLTATPDEPTSFIQRTADQPVDVLTGSDVEAIAAELLSRLLNGAPSTIFFGLG
ncbi:MAG: EAL domain-containing protein, partial [Acidimicrobiales bacterium]|nr:EAL domain-containing protein [Acidimicrobiales bacterium]